MLAAASPAPDPITPGMIAVVQTFSDDAGWNPHVHALATRGGWTRAGQWVPIPFVDGEAAALVFRHKVFSFLQAEGLLSEERTRLLLSWRHSGFSVHNTVTVPSDDRDDLERLARTLLRAPISLERLSFDAASDQVAYARRPGRGHEPGPTAGDVHRYQGAAGAHPAAHSRAAPARHPVLRGVLECRQGAERSGDSRGRQRRRCSGAASAGGAGADRRRRASPASPLGTAYPPHLRG